MWSGGPHGYCVLLPSEPPSSVRNPGSRDPPPPHRVGIVGATAYGMGAAIVLANAAKPTATLATRSTTATAATAAKTTVMLTTMPRGASPRHKWRDSGQLPHEADNLRKIAQAPAAVSS